jgi:hypothetical protein
MSLGSGIRGQKGTGSRIRNTKENLTRHALRPLCRFVGPLCGAMGPPPLLHHNVSFCPFPRLHPFSGRKHKELG